VARVMIAQWDSSLSVLPVARVMIAQWDSSLSVLPVAQVMIAQWNSSLSVLPVARVQFPATAEYFKGFFPGWSNSANPSWASVAENGSISPQRHLWIEKRKKIHSVIFASNRSAQCDFLLSVIFCSVWFSAQCDFLLSVIFCSVWFWSVTIKDFSRNHAKLRSQSENSRNFDRVRGVLSQL